MIRIDGYCLDLRPLVRCKVWKPDCPDHREVVGLIDTGATDCTVRSELAEFLDLSIGPPVHTHNVGVSGLKPSTVIDLLFAGVDESGTAVTYAALQARTLIDDFDPHADIIIGMNVLRLFSVLIINGVPELTVVQ